MKTNSFGGRTLIIMAAILFLGKPNNWAHSPHSRPLAGIVQSIDREKHLLSIAPSKPGATREFLWRKHTSFIADQHFTEPKEIEPGTSVVVYYQSPLFGKPFVTRVVSENSPVPRYSIYRSSTVKSSLSFFVPSFRSRDSSMQ